MEAQEATYNESQDYEGSEEYYCYLLQKELISTCTPSTQVSVSDDSSEPHHKNQQPTAPIMQLSAHRVSQRPIEPQHKLCLDTCLCFNREVTNRSIESNAHIRLWATTIDKIIVQTAHQENEDLAS